MSTKTLVISHRELLCILAGALLSVLLIFATPIRYTALIEPSVHDIDPKEIHAEMTSSPDDYFFIDVRTPADYKKMHAENSANIPIAQFYDKWREFPRSGKEIVLICGGGRLSGVAFFFLQHFGFTNIVRVSGGIENWAAEGLPVVLQESPA